MKKVVLLLFLCCAAVHVVGQSLTLEQCQSLARENHPAIVQQGLIDKAEELVVASAKTVWLPQLSLSAQASYASEVPSLPGIITSAMHLYGIRWDGMPKDQYKAVAEIEQIVWDGGAVKAGINIAKAESEISRQKFEVEMYALRDNVNQLYFGILVVQEKIKETDLLIEELNRHKKLVDDYAATGFASRNDLEVMQVEVVSANQRKSELTAMRKAFHKMLGYMIGHEVGEDAQLIKPSEMVIPEGTVSMRPELGKFDAQQKLYDAQHKGIRSTLMPQVGLMLQGAYANPGLDFLASMQENKWSPYLIAGVQLQWKIGNFYTHKNKRAQIALGKQQVESARASFLYTTELKKTQEEITIERMREVLKDDDEIIALRSSIRKRSEQAYKDGGISVSDMLKDIIAENLAIQNRTLHEMELLKTIYDMKFTINQ